QYCQVRIERDHFYICHRRQKEKLLSTSGTPAAIASASFSANVSASQISKWLPMPISMMSRVSPTAARSSGAIRMRLAVSNSTSEALPRKMRCQARAEIGHLAISSRRLSHTGRGKSSKQPSGCLVKVRRPSHCNCNASRCRAGIVIRPFTSRLREEAPWNTLKSLYLVYTPHEAHAYLQPQKPTNKHFLTLSATLEDDSRPVKQIPGAKTRFFPMKSRT